MAFSAARFMRAFSFGVGYTFGEVGEFGKRVVRADCRIETRGPGDERYARKDDERRLSSVTPRRVEREVKGFVKKRRPPSVQGWRVGRCK